MRLATLIGLNANGDGNDSMLDTSNNASTADPMPIKHAAKTRFVRRSEPAIKVPHKIARPALEASATSSQVLNHASNRTVSQPSLDILESLQLNQGPN